MNKRYIVRLSDEEREELQKIVSTGKRRPIRSDTPTFC